MKTKRELARRLIHSKGTYHCFGQGYHISQDEHDLLLEALTDNPAMDEVNIAELERSLPQIIYSVKEDGCRLLCDYQADIMAEIIIGWIKSRTPAVQTKGD